MQQTSTKSVRREVKDLLQVFAPNKTISKSTAILLVSAQVIVFFLFWIFSPFVFLPTQAETFHAFTELWAGGLGQELMTSFLLNVEAITLASIISLVLAYTTVIPFFRPIVAFISKLRFLSLVGLTFVFTLATNSGHELKLYLLVFSVTVFFVTSMLDVLNSIPKVQYDLARTLRMGEWRLILEVIVLGQMDKVFDVIRQNAAISWMALTMVEGISRSEGGIGALLLNMNKHFHLSSVLAIQLMILLIGLLQDYGIGLLRNLFCPYATLTTERK
jgi:NitT/TauT family transport system permease protein